MRDEQAGEYESKIQRLNQMLAKQKTEFVIRIYELEQQLKCKMNYRKFFILLASRTRLSREFSKQDSANFQDTLSLKLTSLCNTLDKMSKPLVNPAAAKQNNTFNTLAQLKYLEDQIESKNRLIMDLSIKLENAHCISEHVDTTLE